jgi:hypothetical protein
VPLAGVLLFGWSPGDVLFVYCADVLAGLHVVCVPACARLAAFEVRGPARLRPPAPSRRAHR